MTKVTPFFADMGRYPYKGTQPKLVYKSNVQLAQDFANSLTKVQDKVGAVLKEATKDMLKYYNKKCSKLREYKNGDLVWLEATNVMTD